MASTRWFSVTTWRTRRARSPRRAARRARGQVVDVAQRRRRRALAAAASQVRAAGGVLAVGVPVRRAGVDDQHRQTRRSRSNGTCSTARIRQSRNSAWPARHSVDAALVHDAARHADVRVLRPLGQRRPRSGRRLVGAGQVDQGRQHRALQRGRRGQPGTDRDVRGDGQLGRRARRRRPHAAPRPRRRRSRPTRAPRPAEVRRPNVTGSASASELTVHSGRSGSGHAATAVRCGSANGSTKPSL